MLVPICNLIEPDLSLNPLHTGMEQGCTESGHEIEKQEFLRSPHPFKHTSEDEKGVHIEEKVPESPMHEHVGDDLPWFEERRCRIEKSKMLIHKITSNGRHNHHKYVDHDDILCHHRYVGQETGSPVVIIKCHIKICCLYLLRSLHLQCACLKP